MLKLNTISKKIIATVVLCAIVFSNVSMLLNESIVLAANVNEEENIAFTSVFVDGETEKEQTCESTIDNENLAIRLKVDVKEAGYLKNAQIEFKSNSKLNYVFGEIAENSLVESIKENVIKLNQINTENSLDLTIPIKYIENNMRDNLSSSSKVTLSGTYIDNDGDSRKVSKEVTMNLSFLSNSKVTISSELSKFVKFSTKDANEVIAQTLVTVGLDRKNMPLSRTEVEIDALNIDGLNLDKVSVISNERDSLTEKDWNFNRENNKIHISVSDEKMEKDTETFVVTYIFSGNDVKFPIKLNSNITSNVVMEGTEEKISGEYEAKYEVKEKVGDIVTYTSEVLKEELYKGNMIANKYDDNNLYETEYGYKYLINVAETSLINKIALKDIKEEAISKLDDKYDLEKASYYKEVKVYKSSFDNILGEKGKITLTGDGKVIGEITNKSEVIDDKYYVVDLNDKNISKLSIEITKPEKVGNIEIEETKKIVKTDFSKDEIKSFDKISNKTEAYIVYEGDVESKAQNIENSIKLLDTTTSANFYINRDSLGTIVKNQDVELKVEFNNNKEESDFYKNPSFEIVLPENIKEVTIKKVSIINAENELKVKDVRAKYVGKNIVITIHVEGTQKHYSLNNITNGTNLLINTDMTLDNFTSNLEKEIVLKYTNEGATSYNNAKVEEGNASVKVSYVAPSGLISANAISNFDDNNTLVSSVEQGEMNGKIEIYDDSKVATMDIIAMNNNENVVKNVKILGRIPFKGNKDIQTGEDLGTTLDTTMVSKITASSENKVKSTIYYSSKEDATEELNDESNGWVKDVEDLSTVKSYLIVCDEDYEMGIGEKLKFSYDYKIPANLEHNENIYGSFATFFTNMTNISAKNEISVPDKVGLTTGQGPILSVKASSTIEGKDASEYEYINYQVTVTNDGEETAEDIVITVPLPKRTTFATFKPNTTVDNLGGWFLDTSSEKTYKIPSLKAGESKTYNFYAQVNELPSIEEYYSGQEGFTKNEDGTYSLFEEVKDENGEITYKETKIDSLPDVYTEMYAKVTAKDLAKAIESEKITNKINKSNLKLEENVKTETIVVNVNEQMTYEILVKNNTKSEMKNIKIEKVLPKLVTYKEAYVVGYEEDGITPKKINSVSYDESSRKLTWTIDKLEPSRTVHVKLEVMTNDLDEGKFEDTITTNSTVKVNGEEYRTAEISTEIGKPKLVITQTSDVTNKYITKGQVINYKFDIKNEGKVKAQNVTVVDKLPNKVKVQKLDYVSDGIKMEKVVANNEDAVVYTSIQPNNELIVNVRAVALAADKQEEVVTNYADITSENDSEDRKSNEVTHIIEKTEESEDPEEDDPSNPFIPNGNNNQNNTNTSKFKITGSVFLDENRDAKYSKDDRLVSNVEIILINATNGKELNKTGTSNQGTYTFSGLTKGKYYVGFYYNDKKYGVTEYKKDGVADNINSDAYASRLNGKAIALTDVITIDKTSISNIDLGLVKASIFDLSLTNKVSKVTVQNKNGTNKYTFNGDMAKIDIPAKYLSSSKVFVEYKIKVKNEGEIAGYVKQVVDYKEKSLSFDPTMNKGWYEGSDGNIYSEALSKKQLAPGETAELKLVLTKQMTEENTGMINNIAEISKAYNAEGIADRDSTPNNKIQSEDDYGVADVIVSVKTGETLIYMSGVIIAAILAIITVYVLHRNKYKIKRVIRKRKVVD